MGLVIGGAGFALAITAFYVGFKRHKENTTGEDNRHKEAMAALADRRQDAADHHEQAMTALQALIRNNAPRPGPAE